MLQWNYHILWIHWISDPFWETPVSLLFPVRFYFHVFHGINSILKSYFYGKTLMFIPKTWLRYRVCFIEMWNSNIDLNLKSKSFLYCQSILSSSFERKKTILMSGDFDLNPTCVLAKILFIQLKRITICLITCNTGFVRIVFHAQLGGIVRSSAGYLMVR